MKYVLATCVGQIQCDAVLIGVEIQKEPALFRMRDMARVGAALPCLVTGRFFDFDDLGSHICHQFSGVGSRSQVTTFNNTDALKSTFWHEILPGVWTGRVVALLK